MIIAPEALSCQENIDLSESSAKKKSDIRSDMHSPQQYPKRYGTEFPKHRLVQNNNKLIMILKISVNITIYFLVKLSYYFSNNINTKWALNHQTLS